MTQFTDYTFAKPHLLRRKEGYDTYTDITRSQLAFYATNCMKLANYMEALPEEQHDQGTYAHTKDKNGYDLQDCGTPACALGHAAYSNLVPGLQFGIALLRGLTSDQRYEIDASRYLGENDDRVIAMPVINGGWTHWHSAGRYFFGYLAESLVFDQSAHSKFRVVQLLRRIGTFYRRVLYANRSRVSFSEKRLKDEYYDTH